MAKWIQKAFKKIKAKGTEGVCTGAKFGGPTCRPGTKDIIWPRHYVRWQRRNNGR